jgi:FemAB-related protein (PEP-CTERM system-associated)
MIEPGPLYPAATLLPLDQPAVAAEVERWLATRGDATPFHRPAWLHAVARGTGQAALMLGARDAAGALAGVLPLTLVHSPLFGRALVSSGFAVGGGILADTPAVATALADVAWRLAETRSCASVELRGGARPGDGWRVVEDSHLSFVRPLAADDEAELAAIPRKQRAEVRKALAAGYRVTIGRDEALRAAHYALYARSVHNLGTPVFPRALFDAVLDAFGENADILLISDGDRALSSVLTLYHRGVAMPYWQGGDRAARAARSNELLYFALMRHARARGCAAFDFGRSKAGSGPAAYKKNWGFEGVPLRYFTRARPGAEARDVDPRSPRYQRKIALWKALPPAIVDRVGPWIARGLG